MKANYQKLNEIDHVQLSIDHAFAIRYHDWDKQKWADSIALSSSIVRLVFLCRRLLKKDLNWRDTYGGDGASFLVVTCFSFISRSYRFIIFDEINQILGKRAFRIPDRYEHLNTHSYCNSASRRFHNSTNNLKAKGTLPGSSLLRWSRLVPCPDGHETGKDESENIIE